MTIASEARVLLLLSELVGRTVVIPTREDGDDPGVYEVLTQYCMFQGPTSRLPTHRVNNNGGFWAKKPIGEKRNSETREEAFDRPHRPSSIHQAGMPEPIGIGPGRAPPSPEGA